MTKAEAAQARDRQHWRALGSAELFDMGWRDFHTRSVIEPRARGSERYMAGWRYGAQLAQMHNPAPPP